MNFKHLFPSYRSRYLYLQRLMAGLSRDQVLDLGLHIGCKEGEFDRMLASYVGDLVAADVSEEALLRARSRNKGIFNLQYKTLEAGPLPFADGSFDVVVVSELFASGMNSDQLANEISRVLVPGGWAIIVFRGKDFPFTYDPINRIWQLFRARSGREYGIQQGAYAFGTTTLPEVKQMKALLYRHGLEVEEIKSIGGWLVGLLEVYWVGILIDVFKTNDWRWVTAGAGRRGAVTDPPPLTWFTDALLWVDDWWSGMLRQSVAKGMAVRKRRDPV
jgi:SAM-dependent methyltransferase